MGARGRPEFPAETPSGSTFWGGLRFHGLRWVLLLAVALVTYALFPAPTVRTIPQLAVGQAAERAVFSPVPLLVPKSEDEITREAEALAATVRPVYRFSASAYDSALAGARLFFRRIERTAPGEVGAVQGATRGTPVRLTETEAAYLTEAAARRQMADAVQSFLAARLSPGVADPGVVRGEASGEITLRRNDAEVRVPRDSILTFADLLAGAERAAQDRWEDETAQRVFRRLVAGFYRPTVVFDQTTTAARREEMRLRVDTVKYAVRAGERIVDAQQIVTEEVHDKLEALAERMTSQGAAQVVTRAAGGALLYSTLVLSVFWLLLLLYRRETYADLRQMLFFAVLFAVVVLMAFAVTSAFPDRPELIPVPFAAMLITMLFNGRLAATACITVAVLIGGQWALRDGNALFFTLIGGVSAAFGMRAVRRRQSLYITVGVVVAAYALGAITVGLRQGWTLEQIGTSTASGAVSTLLSAGVAMLVLPLAENFTHITTNLTLLELSDSRRPLLRRLALEAPGTWAHSISMANLCEAACDAIGANGLLARVGCYYHDVGKLRNPQYFVENQVAGVNPHDKLKPQQSAQIIRNHVRQGLELAEEAGLPPVVRAFIPEHHGTTDIRFFLHRARGRVPEGELNPSDFRYPGPRPQSAETAIAMLADAAEAALRALEDPTPEAVREAIEQLINQRVSSGQLDEAPLTLRDLDLVKREFVRVMSGVYHNRPEYPRPSTGAPNVEAVGRH